MKTKLEICEQCEVYSYVESTGFSNTWFVYRRKECGVEAMWKSQGSFRKAGWVLIEECRDCKYSLEKMLAKMDGVKNAKYKSL